MPEPDSGRKHRYSVERIKVVGTKIKNLTEKPYKSKHDTVYLKQKQFYIHYSIL